MWDYIEADFRRDYNIRLSDDLPYMSWREFQALLNGLSPWGAVATHWDEEAKKQRVQKEEESGKPSAAANSFWHEIMSMAKPE